MTRKMAVSHHLPSLYFEKVIGEYDIMLKLVDWIGQKFGRLEVVSRANNRKGKAYWNCICVCDKKIVVLGRNLKSGATKSCGCLRDEQNTKRFTTHGMSDTPTHHNWMKMIQRCNNPNDEGYKNYGGRGIKVCNKWLRFENFFEDMGERPNNLTIERVNNSLGYSPENCKWATYTEQNRNRRILKRNTTGFNGVHYAKDRQKYCASITVNYKLICLGYFLTIEQAAKARNAGEQKYWGK